MKKLLTLALALVCTVGTNYMSVYATSVSDDMQQQSIDFVKDFVSNTYEGEYNLLEVNSDILSADVEGSTAQVVVKTNFVKMLVEEDVHDLPFIKGMTKSVVALEKARSTDAALARYVLDEQVEAMSEYIGAQQEQNEIFRVSFDVSDTDLSDATLEVLGLGDEYIPAEYFGPKSSAEQYMYGQIELQKNVDYTKEALAIAYPEVDVMSASALDTMAAKATVSYDRIAARNYANKYTSECGTSYNTAYWNPNYVWHTENGGVDCANYVSQAIYAGGIPKDNTWKPESTAWINTGKNNSGGLTHYMVNKGYFKASTQSACAAGGFMSHTDFSHVIFIVANDGKDLLFSSHTADRLKQSFAGNYYKNMNYYYINPVYNKDLQ